MAELALLRQQLIILKRHVKRPACTKRDRILLLLLATAVRAWKHRLFIIQPETLLRWHCELFRLYWKRRSKASSHKPKVATETIALIRELATENGLWGAERIRGELLKLGMHVCKRTIQKYMRNVRTSRPQGQRWATFLHNYAAQIWACDFLQVTDLFFRPLFAFFIIELKSRKASHPLHLGRQETCTPRSRLCSSASPWWFRSDDALCTPTTHSFRSLLQKSRLMPQELASDPLVGHLAIT